MYDKFITTLIHAPRETIWNAMTDPDLVQRYFFGTKLSTDWRAGSSMVFRGEWQGRPYEDLGTVLTFDPPNSLAFSYWSSFSETVDQPEFRQVIRYDLEDAEHGVRITISSSNHDTAERAEHSAKLWHTVLEGLKKLVETGV